MMSHRIPAFLSVVSLLASGCHGGGGDSEVPLPGTEQHSELPRNLEPQVDASAIAELTAGGRDFAFDLYRQLSSEEGNMFFSPFSISIALAMTYGGARGETEVEMQEVMHYTLGQSGTHEAFNALDLELASRGEGADGSDGEGFRLNIVNKTWGRIGYQFLDSYLDLLAVSYGAGMQLLDFVGDPEGSRQLINDWVAEQTENRIEDLLPQGSIDPSTALVLTNAIYFNAAWQTPFERDLTSDGAFKALTGDVLQVPMMRGVLQASGAAGEGYEAFALPYDGEQLAMVVIVPGEGTFAEFEASLDREVYDSIVQSLGGVELTLSMPKFSFDVPVNLTGALQALGMTTATSNLADFSGMNGVGGLTITDVVHKAFVDVNEEGTEAAAATGVIVGETSVPGPLTIDVDRPFIFAITDWQTGAVLFVGRVVDPR